MQPLTYTHRDSLREMAREIAESLQKDLQFEDSAIETVVIAAEDMLIRRFKSIKSLRMRKIALIC